MREGGLLALLVLAACGGGAPGAPPSFSLVAVSPVFSAGLTGGETVTISGTNFLSVEVTAVTFGGVAATDVSILDETRLTVRTPAPAGAGPVTVEVTSAHAGKRSLADAYIYRDPSPAPQAITVHAFTPTGAEAFAIGGANLGPPGGHVTVTFEGVGSVTGDVTGDSAFVLARAPVTGGAPPPGDVTVSVGTGPARREVPGTVTYTYAAPVALSFPRQAAPGNASEPVRLGDGLAAAATAGANGIWGDADDEILLVRGPPAAPAVLQAMRRGGGSVGYLLAGSARVAALDDDTLCALSVGPDGAAGTADDAAVLVTNARTAPVADLYPVPRFHDLPPLRVSPTTIAFLTAGANGTLGDADDALALITFDFLVSPPSASTVVVPGAGPFDTATGAGNLSLPFTGDGDTVFTRSAGPNGTVGDGDDTVALYRRSSQASATGIAAPSVRGALLATSGTLVAGPGAGPDHQFGTGDDTLVVLSETAGTWSTLAHPLGQALDTDALLPCARIGDGVVAVVVTGPHGLVFFTDPRAGVVTWTQLPGTLLLVPHPGGALTVLGPGPDLAARTADDQAFHVPALMTGIDPFSLAPDLPQTAPVRADADRAFGVTPGPDGTFGTGDEILEVYQSRALGAPRSTSRLPLAGPAGAPVVEGAPFIPVGLGWGLVQSPGANRTFGDDDDQLLLARY